MKKIRDNKTFSAYYNIDTGLIEITDKLSSRVQYINVHYRKSAKRIGLALLEGHDRYYHIKHESKNRKG